MNPRKLSVVVTSLSLVFAVSCSSAKKEHHHPGPAAKAIHASTEVPEPTEVMTKNLKDEVDFASIEFDKGEIKLSEMDRRHLNNLAMKMTSGGKVVDDIRILTWADRAIKKDDDATNTEIILARQRAESIRDYLEKTLPEHEDIDFYNMAESPKTYSSYLKRKGIPLDQAFNVDDKNATASGKALIIIEYQGGPMPSSL